MIKFINDSLTTNISHDKMISKTNNEEQRTLNNWMRAIML